MHLHDHESTMRLTFRPTHQSQVGMPYFDFSTNAYLFRPRSEVGISFGSTTQRGKT